ncbi:class I SAM-dependent methyltransferase [Micromonospora sp. NPDC050795]|uniref:class I SAM-dependent methyltransferase n=1 Tax=Micromonospora sp. NPDC050795 TaxID=3364282 RepID=UPI00379B7490
MKTTTHNGQVPAQLRELLDPTIRQELDRLDIRPGHFALEVGAGTGEITAHLASLVGQYGTVSAVDNDTSYLNPTAVINVYHRDLGRDTLPGDPNRFNLVIARWLHGALPHPAGVLEQMISRLRPGGWLVLADVTGTPARVFRAPGDDAALIHAVLRRVYRTIAGPDAVGSWTVDAPALLVAKNMVQVCTHTSTETWTGNGPGCRLLADAVNKLRPVLTTTEINNNDLDRFIALMSDPGVVLGSYERRAIHARKAS